MTKPQDAKDTSAKPAKPAIQSDTFTQVPDSDSENVKGGMLPRGGRVTTKPTGSDGCCGEG
jgi:hypothetical protein